ncbi:Hsp20/alpha crystallin family protein [Myxococcota bacterium]|nr:Hsp20/alpha crystallin family protein [Myxococcota bacterium]
MSSHREGIDFGEFSDRLSGGRWQPDVDVFESETEIIVRVELAGVERQDVRVGVDGRVLRISGTRRAPDTSEVQRLLQMEIASGPFERSVTLPAPFERDRVSARLKDGVLTIVLPNRRPMRVEVEASDDEC